MELDHYQREAARTDQYPGIGKREESISLFGLIGEIGSLITIFKKRLRDKAAYVAFHDDLKEELGDVLWYLANLADKYGISLDEVARTNLDKTKALWLPTGSKHAVSNLYDETYPVDQQLPRRQTVTFAETGEISDGGFNKVRISVDGETIGDSLTDNAYGDDGYRFHDCLHLAFAAVLGWSPVFRRMTGRKRKSDHAVDEVEDGARASFTEEFISLYIYQQAKEVSFYEGVHQVDEEILRTIKTVVKGFEVESRTAWDWKNAILQGFSVFRKLKANKGGRVELDLESRTITYVGE